MPLVTFISDIVEDPQIFADVHLEGGLEICHLFFLAHIVAINVYRCFCEDLGRDNPFWRPFRHMGDLLSKESVGWIT